MAYSTAYLARVRALDARKSSLGPFRRISGVVASVVGVAGAGLLVASIALASAWIIVAPLFTGFVAGPKSPTALERVALAERYRAPEVVGSIPDRQRAAREPEAAQDPALDVQQIGAGILPLAVFDPFFSKDLFDAGQVAPPPAAQAEAAPAAASPPAPVVTASLPPPEAVANKRVRTTETRSDSLAFPDRDGRTAIYDIAAHSVYLPNGEKLEAHSGLGNKKDDPRYVSAKNSGPTPPNVYHLSLRERLFHGVRAIRMTPIGDGKMYGRDGILAHSYMLGPNGQSNGCVSFKNYPTFLRAFLKGDVSRVVVVARLAGAPGRAARARGDHADHYALNNQSPTHLPSGGGVE
jgi:hypothetical protein